MDAANSDAHAEMDVACSQGTSLSEAAAQLDSFDDLSGDTVMQASMDSTTGQQVKRHCASNAATLDVSAFKELLDQSNAEARKLSESDAVATRMQIDAVAEEARRRHNEIMAEVKHFRDTNYAHVKRVSDVANKALAGSERNRDWIERSERSLDLTVRGVPLNGREPPAVLRQVMVKIGRVLGVELNAERLVHVFRVKFNGHGGEKDPMLIARFGSPGARSLFYSAYFAKRDLSTLDLGFNVSQRIFISDNLTRQNSVLRGLATVLKKAGKIFNFNTRGGLVNITLREGQPQQTVFSEIELDNLVSNGGSRVQKRLRNDQHVQHSGQRAGAFSAHVADQRASCPVPATMQGSAEASALAQAPSSGQAPSPTPSGSVCVPVGPASGASSLSSAVNALAIVDPSAST